MKVTPDTDSNMIWPTHEAMIRHIRRDWCCVCVCGYAYAYGGAVASAQSQRAETRVWESEWDVSPLALGSRRRVRGKVARRPAGTGPRKKKDERAKKER